MAADCEENQRTRKRKRVDHSHPKLLPDEKVEVRSLEEGFLGSWHCATVIHYDSLVRKVRYDHLLSDDGGSNLIDCVNVAPLIDGIDTQDVRTNGCRGLIRPLPPSLDLGIGSLHYGQCIDMHLEDAWWEGVVFDHEDGSSERKIFFPDMGDEMKAHIETLRITQEWDERTEKWKPRGKWLFLELIEEIEQEYPLFVSLKQIWYEVRVKKGYEELREWTSSAADTWRKLVLQVLCDNFKFTIKQIVHDFNSSQDLVEEGQPLLKLCEPALDAVLTPMAIFGNSLAIVPFGVSDGLNSVKVTCSSMPSHHGLPQAHPVLTIVPANPDQLLDISCSKNAKGLSTSSAMCHGQLKSRKGTTKLEWFPAGLDMVPEPKFCPDAITEYCKKSNNKRSKKKLVLDARGHLSYLGWKIEFANDKGMTRMRYFSPAGKCYFSLFQVCQELEPQIKSQSPIYEDDRRSLSLNPPDDQRSLSLITQDFHQRSLSPITQDSHRSSISADGCCILSSVNGKRMRHKGEYKFRCISHDLAFEREYHPQAVKDYLNGVKEDTALKVKKHLAACGWSFRVGWKATQMGKPKQEMRYYSPCGKIFYSLKTACAWHAEVELINADVHARERQVMNVSKDQKSLLALKGSSRPSIDLKILESPSFHGDDLSEKLQSESPSGMLLPIQLIQKGKTKICGKQKLQKRKKKGLADSLLLIKGQEPVPSIKVGDDMDANSSAHVLQLSKRARQGLSPSAHQTPRTIISWLIDNNVVLPRAKVHYRGGKDGHIMAEGRITRDGIKCSCCQNVFSLSNFEAHAGSTKHRPSANIFLEDGRSLFECQVKLKNGKKSRRPGPEPRETKSNRHYRRNDYICSVCHYGGQLVLCDQCPSSFHTSCLGMKEIPDGDWFCPSCCCGICGQSRFNKNTEQLTDNHVVSCSQCEHQYHFGCLRDRGSVQRDNYPLGDSFCSEKCQQIFQGLRKLLGKPIPVGIDNLTWTLLKHKNSKEGEHDELYDESLMETYSKLNVALSVMHECFEPVKEPRTRRDIVEDVIFSRGSQLNRLNFKGFYTMLLEKNDELITVATVRVHGEKVAEIPLVGTRFQYRRLGMCRILINELEKKLMELGVEKLVLPAVPSVLNTWTTSFGFSKMNECERSKYLDCSFLDFQGTVMCQKLLREIPSSDLNQSTEPLQTSSGHTNKTSSMDLDGNSSVSEVYQADQLEKSELDGQGSAEAGGVGSHENVPSMMAIEANQPHVLDCSVEVAEDKEAEKSCNAVFKSYKRRRISAC